jgi:hypothetical protein
VQTVGKYFNRQIFWLDYNNSSNQLPGKDWLCLAIANNEPDENKFDKFVRDAISKNILEFKANGQFGELLHDLFDQTMVIMETMEQHKAIDVMTTWHNDETLADAFWQCFFATCLPGTTSQNDIKIICTDLDGINRTEELKNYLKEFESGWLPSHNVKHEVWKDREGLTTLCFADERGDDCRKLLEPGTELVHSFYAASHYEAMTIYYKFMNWGAYTTEFEIDRQPSYEKKSGS